jgi:hypothetical protein
MQEQKQAISLAITIQKQQAHGQASARLEVTEAAEKRSSLILRRLLFTL